ncbi:MAG: hypothetical protein ACLUIQ_11620 [Dialister invisus]
MEYRKGGDGRHSRVSPEAAAQAPRALAPQVMCRGTAARADGLPAAALVMGQALSPS